RESTEELELAEGRAERAPAGFGGTRRRFAVVTRGEGCHHRSRPAPTVGGQLLAPGEGGTREIPGGDVHEPRKTREVRIDSCRARGSLQVCPQLPSQRVRRVAGCAPVALLTPPLQARMRHVMIGAGPQALADLPLDATQCRERRLLGGC